MTGTALRRLAGMAPGELRFRASCELRKKAGSAGPLAGRSTEITWLDGKG